MLQVISRWFHLSRPHFFFLSHTISFNSCQQGTEFFRAWPAQTCTRFISRIKHLISIQAQTYNLFFHTEYLKMRTLLRCYLLFLDKTTTSLSIKSSLMIFFAWKSTQLFIPFYKLLHEEFLSSSKLKTKPEGSKDNALIKKLPRRKDSFQTKPTSFPRNSVWIRLQGRDEFSPESPFKPRLNLNSLGWSCTKGVERENWGCLFQEAWNIPGIIAEGHTWGLWREIWKAADFFGGK